jgi:hypothetical protein
MIKDVSCANTTTPTLTIAKATAFVIFGALFYSIMGGSYWRIKIGPVQLNIY